MLIDDLKMVSKKRKEAIIKAVLTFSNQELCELRRLMLLVYENENIFNKMLRIQRFSKSGGYINKQKLEGYYINKALNLQVQNDAPRGGRDGDFIVIPTKLRYEVEFLKNFLTIF